MGAPGAEGGGGALLPCTSVCAHTYREVNMHLCTCMCLSAPQGLGSLHSPWAERRPPGFGDRLEAGLTTLTFLLETAKLTIAAGMHWRASRAR